MTRHRTVLEWVASVVLVAIAGTGAALLARDPFGASRAVQWLVWALVLLVGVVARSASGASGAAALDKDQQSR